MSYISSILSGISPWCHSTNRNPCDDISHVRFGINDTNSTTTQHEPKIATNADLGTANFENPRGCCIHCFHIGDLAAEIPENDADGMRLSPPRQCDEILYLENRDLIVFVEMKVTKSRGTKIGQLKDTLEGFSKIPDLLAFLRSFKERRCCFFQRSPPVGNLPQSLNNAVSNFIRKPTQPVIGRKVKNTQLTSEFDRFGFALWHCQDGAFFKF